MTHAFEANHRLYTSALVVRLIDPECEALWLAALVAASFGHVPSPSIVVGRLNLCAHFFSGVCIIRADCIDESTVDGVEQIRSIGWPLSGHVCACVCVPIVSVRTGLEEMSVRLTHIHNFSLHKIVPIWRSVDMAMRLNDTLNFGWTDGPGRLMECEPHELNVY